MGKQDASVASEQGHSKGRLPGTEDQQCTFAKTSLNYLSQMVPKATPFSSIEKKWNYKRKGANLCLFTQFSVIKESFLQTYKRIIQHPSPNGKYSWIQVLGIHLTLIYTLFFQTCTSPGVNPLSLVNPAWQAFSISIPSKKNSSGKHDPILPHSTDRVKFSPFFVTFPWTIFLEDQLTNIS